VRNLTLLVTCSVQVTVMIKGALTAADQTAGVAPSSRGAPGAGAQLTGVTVNVTVDRVLIPTPLNVLSITGASGWEVSDCTLVQDGGCTGYFPWQYVVNIVQASDGVFIRNTVINHCMGYAIGSSQRLVVDGNRFISRGSTNSEGNSIHSMMHPDVPVENLYIGRNYHLGSPPATNCDVGICRFEVRVVTVVGWASARK
jgi:hypothetical protein